MLLRRRHLLSTAALPWLGGAASAGTALGGLATLPRTARLPVLFLGHGSPMNAIEDNPWRRGWQALGQRFGQDWPVPAVILCISAHWLTTGWWVTGMPAPRTVHDFGGFPQALFDQEYPAPGAPALAQDLVKALPGRALRVDGGEWGLDHGTWSVLKPMFPRAEIPVLQLSMDYARPPEEHLALAAALRPLRERGVLIVGSGNVVHNLRAVQRDTSPMRGHDWALAFDRWVGGLIDKGDGAALAAFQKQGELARLAHPTHDHFLPLLHAMGAVAPGEPVRQFNTGYQSASIAMRSVVWG